MPERVYASEQPIQQSDAGGQTTYTSILEEHDVARQQRETRKKILAELESPKLNNGYKTVGVVGYVSHDQLLSADIPVLGNMLRQIGDVEVLTLILHSPGGDGTVVEKFVALCRTHCDRFQVVIPTEAKSAATLIALGADEIIMGPPSEIGPIDAQVPIQVSGVRRYASAQSFIDARNTLLAQHAKAIQDGKDPAAILQMIASLDLPFIVECERLMEFGRDVGRKLLVKGMLRRLKERETMADKIVKQLSSVELHKVHGRTIDGATARSDLKLRVRLCGNNEPFWCKVWEWYTRAEIMMARTRAFKMFETRSEQLSATYQ